MFCSKCGWQTLDDAIFCANCGSKLESEMQTAAENPVALSRPAVTPPTPQTAAQPSKKKNTTASIVVVILCVVFLLGFIGYIVVGWLDLDLKDWAWGKSSKISIEQNSVPITTMDVEPTPSSALDVSVEPAINSYIDSVQRNGDISVAVFDNITNKTYNSNMSDLTYSAWGFYVPVYLAADDMPGRIDGTIRENIMSSDAGVCNNAGNTVIRALGGPAAVTAYLSDQYDTFVTSYGRYFADLNATGENYTNAREAVQYLRVLNSRMDYTKLSYNLGSFGISAPSGAAVYAQVGTENKSKMENVNVFAVVKGIHSDYCIAVLTKNGAAKNNAISNLMHIVHQEMERIHA